MWRGEKKRKEMWQLRVELGLGDWGRMQDKQESRRRTNTRAEKHSLRDMKEETH